MARVKLTDRRVQALRTEKVQEEFWDAGFAGGSFGVRVSAQGRKSFVVMYRNGDRLRRMTLGAYPALKLADARDRAKQIVGDVARGKDPARAKQEHRNAETFAGLADLFMTRYAYQRAERTRREYQRQLDHDLLPSWGRRKAADITKADVIDVLDHIAHDRGSVIQANRTRALIHKIFAFAMTRDILQANPCSGLPKPGEERHRERVLTDSEIVTLWQALDDEQEPIASLYRLLLLTAQRPGEVRAMRWAELDGDLWTIPAEIVKNRRTHPLPLSPQALGVLAHLEPLTGQHEHVIHSPSNRGNGPVKWLSYATRRLREACGFEFRPHDLRRTATSGMAALGTDRVTLAKILNHKSAENEVTAIYDRYGRLPEMRRALVAWGERVKTLASGREKSAKVVRIY